MYRLTGDVVRSYRWSATDLWAEEVSSKFLRFGFLIYMVIGGKGCPQILAIFVLDEKARFSSDSVILYWLGGMVFPLKISKVNKVT
jgi:hypothetical protein